MHPKVDPIIVWSMLFITPSLFQYFFFFNDTATTEIYTLSYTTLFRSTCRPTTLRIRLQQRRSRTSTPPRCRSEEHTSELQSQSNLVCRLLLEKTNRQVSRRASTRRTQRPPAARTLARARGPRQVPHDRRGRDRARARRTLLFFFFNDTATTEIYTLSHTTLFRSQPPTAPAMVLQSKAFAVLTSLPRTAC